jgi:DNA-binding SARP family transcriptional activator
MLVRALGPVELHAVGQVIVPGGPKPKALLAALAVHVRQVVAIDRLVDLIWDERPPSSAPALVHQYVSQVRRGFARAGARAVLATRAPGYQLHLRADQLDLEVFAQLVRAAGKAEQAGDPAGGARAYRQALDLWRGPAFGGVDTRFARNHAAGLDAERLTAEEGLARCLLGLGLVTEAITRLTALTAAHPLREESRGLLMRALYVAGRPADAISAYHDGRTQVVDHLRRRSGRGAAPPVRPDPRRLAHRDRHHHDHGAPGAGGAPTNCRPTCTTSPAAPSRWTGSSRWPGRAAPRRPWSCRAAAAPGSRR